MRSVTLVWALLMAFSTTSSSQTSLAGLAYSLESDAVSAREPVGLSVTVSNKSDQAIAVDFGREGTQNLTFSVLSPDGSTKTIVPPLRKGLAPRGDFKILPGKSLAKHIVLNEWFDFTAVGQYRIEVRLTSPITDLQGEVVATDPGTQFRLTCSRKMTVSCKRPARACWLRSPPQALMRRLRVQGRNLRRSQIRLLFHIFCGPHRYGTWSRLRFLPLARSGTRPQSTL